jgi:hypothetical protein
MTFHEIISLMGLKSTAPEISQFFETNNLGKPPKTVNANQGLKGIQDKQNKLTFGFKFDITNEQFYPPVSPKQDDYNFNCYLYSVVVLEVSGKKKVADPKPATFWDGFINPESSYDECLTFFANGEIKNTIMKKPLNDVVEVVVWFSEDKSKLTAMELRIIEARELFSMYELDARYTRNTVKQAYWLLVKWLFDNKYLLLPEEAFEAPFSFDDKEILEFTGKYLRNHLWTTQLINDKALISFLYAISSNSSSTTSGGEKVNIYIKHLFIKAAGKWDQHQEIYNNESMDAVDEFERNVHLDEAQSNVFLQSLTDKFELFK